MRHFAFCCLAFATAGAALGITTGNLLPDAYEPDNLGGVLNWTNVGGAGIEILDEKGPEGKLILRLNSVKGLGWFTHRWLALTTNGEYRLSVSVRTHGGVGKNGNVQIHNHAWDREVRLPIPRDTHGAWRRLEWQGRLPASHDGKYGVSIVFYEAMPEGFAVDIADLRMEALDARDAAAAPSRPAAVPFRMRLSPVEPELDRIDHRAAKMRFYYPGELSPGLGVRATISGRTAEAPIDEKGFATVDFGPITEGRHLLRVELTGGNEAVSNDYACSTARTVVDPTPGRRLNNFVTELYTKDLRDGEYEFTLDRDRYVYIGLDRPYRNVEVDLDGSIRHAIRYRENEPSETIRHLEAGRHVFRVRGVECGCVGGTVSVRIVKCIYSCFGSTVVRELDFCRNEYARGYCKAFGMLSGVTSSGFDYNAREGALAEGFLREYGERGIELLYDVSYNPEDADRFDARRNLARLLSFPAAKAGKPILIDENAIAADTPAKYNMTEAVWDLRTRGICVNECFCDGFTQLFRRPRLDIPELSAYVNSGGGRGMMLAEAYYRSVSDEAGYRSTVDFMRRQIRGLRELVPSAPGHFIYLMSGWQIPSIWTTWLHVDMDMNAFLSRIVGDLATDPEFADIGGIGFSTPVCEEDQLRFTHAAFRHYCIEGRTDDFALRHGMTLFNSYLQNGDFDKGLDGWTVLPARSGGIVHRHDVRIKRYQHRNQQWTAHGDDFALFTPSREGTNRLEQTIRGLSEGKLYVLTFAAMNYADIQDPGSRPNEPSPRVRASFCGVDEIPELTHIVTLRSKSNRDWSKAATTVHRYVFRAKSTTARLILDDGYDVRRPSAEDPVAVNYIICRPYYVADEDEFSRLRRFYSDDTCLK